MTVKPNKQMLTRTFIVMVSIILCLTIVSTASLVHIMIIKGDKYQSMASEQQLYDNLISAPRGDIYDRNMKVLATSSTAWTVYVTPNGINKLSNAEKAEKIRKTISENLSRILGLDEETVYNKTKQNTYYVIIKKKVEKAVADEVRTFISDNKDLEITKYVGLDETTKRFYPNDTLASTVLGFVGDDDQGLAGLESYYDNELTGIAGRVVAAKNAKGTDMKFTYEKVEEATKGSSLVSTIDSYVQYVSEKYLDIAIEEEKISERGAVVTMNVNTGEILGIAVSGDFNPNEPFKLSAEDQAKIDAVTDQKEKNKLENELLNRQWRNKAVSDTYEPGSVFKIFTAAAALEEDLVNPSSSFTCNYSYTVSGWLYHCHKKSGHGTQNLAEAMANSCNPAFIQIGQLLGISSYNKYFKAFGLTEKTGIDLPGEATPYYHKESDMGVIELSSSSFGQSFNITPIHMISLAAAAVNGGYLVKPHVVQKMLDSEGNVTKTFSNSSKRQVVSAKTSETLRLMLEQVVESNSKAGKVAGYRVGGKTGTSEKLAKMAELNVKGLYIGSYVGIAPIDNPEIAVFVMLDEPMGGRYYGSQISAPVAAKVMADILPYLGFEPQYSENELKHISVVVPDVKGTDLETAKNRVTSNKLAYKVVGNGTQVINQLPAAGTSMYNGGTVILYTDSTEAQDVTVPNLIGLTVSEVNTVAESVGINVVFSGNTSSAGLKSYNQSIKAGETVKAGEVVAVYFREEGSADLAED